MKRQRANVRRPDIDRFIGALSGQYAQGIFITTAGYAPQAALKASSAIPRIATVDGDQVIALMLRHSLGVVEQPGPAHELDEEYFRQFEAQAAMPGRITERPEEYQVGEVPERPGRPEDDFDQRLTGICP